MRVVDSLAADISPRVRGLLIKNLGDFQTELARVHAGFVPALRNWEQRKELPALIFRSLRRVQDLRHRGRELGLSFQEMHLSRHVAGRALLDELCRAPSVPDFLEAGIVRTHRLLIEAIDAYLKRNDTIYDQPLNPFVFGFIGESSSLPVEIDNGEVWVGGRAVGLGANDAPAGHAQLFFRPHDVELVPEGAALAGVVAASRRVGGTRRVELEIGGDAQRVEIDLPFDHPAGEKTRIAFKPKRWKIYPQPA